MAMTVDFVANEVAQNRVGYQPVFPHAVDMVPTFVDENGRSFPDSLTGRTSTPPILAVVTHKPEIGGVV